APDPLPLEGLKAADTDIMFKANKLITRSITLDKVNLALKLNNGKLQIDPLSAKVAGGDMKIAVNLDASSGKSAALKNSIQIKQLELGQLPQLKEKNLLSGGKTDIMIDLSGRGSSVAQIAGSANGKLLITTGNGKILNKTVDLAGADVIFSALNMINPMAEKEEHTTLECAVVKFDVKDGMATTDRGIALRTKRLNVSGSGTVDLKTEALNLAVKPRAREGLGINIGSLVDAVQVSGTLAEPSAGVSAEGALTAGITAGAAVATGGLSVLTQGLFDSSSGEGDVNPCDIALGKAQPRQAARPAGKKAKEKSAVESTVDTAKDAVEGVTEGAGKLLKGLFD
ncbi:MAG: AsmA family protein, partial [Thiotrichales bacterium]|nr:AsmA family protein [Thiotrichales bacterium]